MLSEMKNDLNFLKEKIIRIEITINDFDSDVHNKINPENSQHLNDIEPEFRPL